MAMFDGESPTTTSSRDLNDVDGDH